MDDLLLVGAGAGVFLLLALLTLIVMILANFAKKLDAVFHTIDRALVPFGQSALGQFVHQAAATGRTYVDQPGDPAVIRLTDVLNSAVFVVQVARAAGIEITRERVALWGRALFDTLDALTDGEPEPTL